ncbi:MAG: hypothetical protein ACTHLJ_01830 [Angustibacter sp.]
MPRRLLAVTTALALGWLPLTACSQAEDAARSAASDAAIQAADSLRSKAQQEAVKQACGLTRGSGPLADGQVSANERAAVASIASVAEQAGVPKQYTDPLQTIGDSETGKAATAKAVNALKQACAS